MRLNQVTVGVSDIPTAVAFYRKLGLQQIVAAEHYARFVCPEGDATFSVHRQASVGATSTTVYFECDALDAQVRLLKSVGVQFAQDPIDQPWLWREAHLQDPDGNRIILFSAGENRINPPWRLQDA